MLSCKDVTRLINKSMDEALTRKERFGIAMHVMICRYCRRFKKQIQWLRDICLQESTAHNLFDEKNLPQEARLRIINNIHKKLEQ